jgi:PAS domain S-box-containing protein
MGEFVVRHQPKMQLHSLQDKHDATLGELQNYKLLVDSVQDYAIFLMDSHGFIRTWNKGAARLKGYTTDDIVGKHFSQFYQAEDKESGKPQWELEVAAKVGRVEDEGWRLRKDGSRFWASVIITALFDGDGTLIGYAKVTRDLTERKQQEDNLRHANELLRAQQRELQLLNQSKDEFISLASHQLRTPATAIKQLLGLFVEGFMTDMPEENLEIIKKAYESNQRQIAIVNSLLKVAQVDAGKVKLKIDECSLRQLLESIIDDFTDTFKQKKQSVDLIVEDESMNVPADSQHLRMALENLVSNASKYTYPYGTIRIMVVRENGMMKITISDNGVGIAKQDIENLFQKFKRIPNDLSEEVGGSGLGLYWANKVVALHGGQINVESELNQGTAFTVYLPLQ